MISAGGGPGHFDAQRLFVRLAGSSASAESRALTNSYGEKNVAQFFVTFNAFVNGALQLATKSGVKLPAPSASYLNGPALGAGLYAAGVMPDGRFDVGYMLEKLLSRTMHKTLMDEVNGDPKIGPSNNAEFHVILTRVMRDLEAAQKKTHA